MNNWKFNKYPQYFFDIILSIFFYCVKFSRRVIENEYINTSIEDIYQKYSKHFQDPTGELFEFARWCPYLELEPHKFLHNEM